MLRGLVARLACAASRRPTGAVSELLEELRGLPHALEAERPVARPDADLAEGDDAHAIASEVEMSR